MTDEPLHDAPAEPSNLWGLRRLVVSGDCRLGAGVLVDACQAADIELTFTAALQPTNRSVAERFACAVQREVAASAKGEASGSETMAEHCSGPADGESVAAHFARPPGRALRPLEVVGVDCFLLDIRLAKLEGTRRRVGRPWLTLLVDKSSAKVFGHYVSFNPPSAAVVLAALERNGLDLKASAALAGFQSVGEHQASRGCSPEAVANHLLKSVRSR